MNEFNIKLTVEQVNTVLNALAEMPFKLSNQLINEIATQCKQQQDGAAEAQEEAITAA